MTVAPAFDPACQRCPRLAGLLDELRTRFEDYHNAPVPPFGDPDASLLIVGLAPGLHGANASGRPFTGDFAGILLYKTLYQVGLSSAPESVSATDHLVLTDCRITNAVKCLPPANKPVGAEINQCNQFLAGELAGMRAGQVILALGGIAHRAVVRAFGYRQKDYPFGHGLSARLDNQVWLVSSYHCSRYKHSNQAANGSDVHGSRSESERSGWDLTRGRFRKA